MYSSVYTFVLLIQLWERINLNDCYKLPLVPNKVLSKKNIQSFDNLKRRQNAEDCGFPQEAKLFENIHEVPDTTTFNSKRQTTTYSRDETLSELKSILLKMLCKLDNMEESNKEQFQRNIKTFSPLPTVKEITEMPIPYNTKKQRFDQISMKRKPRWGKWTSWSACSVSCGKGREIRWRHCIEECDAAETEMEEKTCQLPACAPKHLFGIN